MKIFSYSLTFGKAYSIIKTADELAGMAKSADARDLKSLGVTSVPVQVRLPASRKLNPIRVQLLKLSGTFVFAENSVLIQEVRD